MEHDAKDLNPAVILNQFRSNSEVYRNTMEKIFQRYSNLDDPGVDFCLKTMTYKTKKGTLPLGSAAAERKLKHLRSCVEHQQSQVIDGSIDEHIGTLGQDLSTNLSTSQVDEAQKIDLDSSSQMELNIDSMRQDSKISLNSTHSSRSCLLFRPPEEEDEELERTLSSHGSTLLDFYPSMINQINESCRRQHATQAAATVVRRYRNKRWQSTKALNGTFSSQKTSKGSTSSQNSRLNCQVVPLPRSKMDCWSQRSVRNTSSVSNDRFYSPKRDDAEACAQTERRSDQTGMHSFSETEHRPVRVLDLLTPSSPDSSSFCSMSVDLNQTYTVNFVPTQRSHDVGPSVACSPNYKQSNSSLKETTSPVVGQAVNLGISLPSRKMSDLGRKVFREHLYFHNPSEKHTISDYSSSLRSPLKPQAICLEQGQRSSPINYQKQMVPRNGNGTAEVYGPGLRSPLKPQAMCLEQGQRSSPISYQKQMVPRNGNGTAEVYGPGLRSPLKPQAMCLEQGQRSSPINYQKQMVPANGNSTAEVYGSPYRGQLSSHWHPCHSSSNHKENWAMSLAEKRQQSLSSQQPYMQMVRKEVDTEFARLYHHFVCRSISSGSTSCHLCRLEKKVQSPATSSFSMSALALTPLRGTLKKRRRQAEVEESLRFKRFRESCSPLGPNQTQQLQASRYMSPVPAEPSEDKHTWNRAVLLHCPSPMFLRASSNIRKGVEAKLDQQIQPSWRAPMRYAGEDMSPPMGMSNQRPASLTSRLSRRRLLYKSLQC